MSTPNGHHILYFYQQYLSLGELIWVQSRHWYGLDNFLHIEFEVESSQGNVGGGLATLINRRMEFENKEDQDLMVLAGMSGAMGALFPTPVLAVLMIHELATPPK